MCSKCFPATSKVTTDPKTSRNERHWDPSQWHNVTDNIQKNTSEFKNKANKQVSMSHSTTPQYIMSYWEMNFQQSWLRLKCRSKFTTTRNAGQSSPPFFWRPRYWLTRHLTWAPLTTRGKAIHNTSKSPSGGACSTAEIAENHWNTLTFLSKLRGE